MEDYEDILSIPKGTPEFWENREQIQEASFKFYKIDYCQDSFREWMPESHEDWDQFVMEGDALRSICNLYLKDEGLLKEWEKQHWKERGCETLFRDD